MIGAADVAVTVVNKVAEGRPHIVDMIKNGEISLIINTVDSKPSVMRDSYSIRHAALQGRVTYYTTLAGARAACVGMQHLTELRFMICRPSTSGWQPTTEEVSI